MDISSYKHIKLAIFLLKVFGLWPHQPQSTRHRNFLIFVTWSTFILIPMAQCLIDTPDLDLQIYYEIIIAIGWIIVSLYLGSMLYLKSHCLLRFYEQVQSDWKIITDPEEIAIMEKFIRQSQILSFVYTGSVVFSVILFLVLNYLPVMIGNAEESAKMVSSYSYRWIIREDLRKYQVIIHISAEMFYGILVYIAVMIAYICGVKHTCAMNAIASYKLRKLIVKTENDEYSWEQVRSDDKIIPGLLAVVDTHRSAIKSASIVNSIFSETFYKVQTGILLCLAMMYFGIQSSFVLKDLLLTLKSILFIFIYMEHLLYLNYGGDQIMDYSNEIFMSTYHMDWYLMSPNARRLLVMIILRSSKTERLSAGLMTLSLESLFKIIRVSWSIATVFSFTQKIASMEIIQSQ